MGFIDYLNNPIFAFSIIILLVLLDREEIVLAFVFSDVPFMVIETFSSQEINLGSLKYAAAALVVASLRNLFIDRKITIIKSYDIGLVIFILLLFILQIVFPDLSTSYRFITLLTCTAFPFLYFSIFKHDIAKIYRFLFYYGLFSIAGTIFTLTTFQEMTLGYSFKTRIVQALAVKGMAKGTSISLARSIGHGFILCSAGFFLYKNQVTKIILASMAIILGLSLVNALERAPLIGIFPVFVFWFFVARYYNFKIYEGARLWGFILGLILSVMFPVFFYQIFYPARLTEMGLLESVSRIEIYYWVIERFWENPIVGRGLDFIINNYYTHSHNILLQVACEMGIIGLLLFLSILAGVTRQGLRTLQSNNNYMVNFCLTMALSLFIYDFIQAQVSGDLFSNYSIWIDLGIASAIIKNRQVTANQPVMANQLQVVGKSSIDKLLPINQSPLGNNVLIHRDEGKG